MTHKTFTARRGLTVLLALSMALALLTGCGTAAAPAAEIPAETAEIVMKNGVVYTMDADMTVATALAVKGDSIIYVGDDAGAEALVGADTQVIDLEGKMVTPGYIDSHTSPADGVLMRMYKLNLGRLDPTEESYKAAIKEFADEHPEMEVLVVVKWRMDAFGGEYPTAAMLDEVVTDRPVICYDSSNHFVWMNSKAMEIEGLNKDSEDIPGGIVYRYDDGTPTGTLSDNANMYYTGKLKAMASYNTVEGYTEGFQIWQDECLSLGITGFCSDGSADRVSYNTIAQALSQMEKDGKLHLRSRIACMVLPIYDFDERLQWIKDATANYTTEYTHFNTFKTVFDGVVEGKTAMLKEPYAETAGAAPDFKGECSWADEEVLLDRLKTVNAQGIQIHIHTIGDGAVAYGLDMLQKVYEDGGSNDNRDTLAHNTVIQPEDEVRFNELNVIAAMPFIWCYRDPVFSQLEEQMLGSERFKRMYCIKDLLDAGALITGHADYDVSDQSVLNAIEAGVTQGSPYPGEDTNPAYVRNADQGVSVLDMLKIYTWNGAYQMGMEDVIGSLETGKKADLVVLGYDITQCAPTAISDAPVVYTLVNGEIVYQG